MESFKVINDTYYFDCTKCGNCCTGEIRITLNLFDLHKLARFLGMNSTRELFDKNYVHLFKHEHDVWLPEIKFKTSPLKFCPFLINDVDDKKYIQGLCSLHPDHKPLICALSPVGRIIDFYDDSDQFVFIKPATDCLGVDSEKMNRLSDDIAQYTSELSLQKRFFKILEQLGEAEYPEEYYTENLYLFPIHLEFHEIIQSIEEKLDN